MSETGGQIILKPLLVRLYDEARGRCYYCTRQVWHPKEQPNIPRVTPLKASADHKIPKSRGGTRSNGNLVLACYACNHLKGDLSEAEFEAEVLWAVENDVKLLRTINGTFKPIAYTNRLFRQAAVSTPSGSMSLTSVPGQELPQAVGTGPLSQP